MKVTRRTIDHPDLPFVLRRVAGADGLTKMVSQ